MSGRRRQIAEALVARIQTVTQANGYTQDVVTVVFDKVKTNISQYNDSQLPAVQIIDMNSLYKHEARLSKTSWFVAVEVCLRSTEVIGEVDQRALWDLQEDIIQAIMRVPNLGLSWMQHVKLVDAATDLHLQEPNYVATIGLEIMFYETIVT